MYIIVGERQFTRSNFPSLKKLYHHVSKTFKSAADQDPIFKKFTTPIVTKLVKPKLKDDMAKATIFSKDVKEYVIKGQYHHW